MDSEQNRIGLSTIAFDWFDNRTHSKIDVRFCPITEHNRRIGVRLNFALVRLDNPGKASSFVLLPVKSTGVV